VGLVVLPDRGSLATDECLTAPNRQPSEGGHWYYHVDRTSNRKCWSLKPIGTETQSTVPTNASPRMPVTQQTAKAAAEPPANASRVQQPMPIHAAANANEIYQATDQRAVEKSQGAIVAFLSSNAIDAGRSNITTTGSANHGADLASEPQAANRVKGQSSAEEPTMAMVDPKLALALLAGAVAIAGMVGNLTFRNSWLRFPRRIEADTAYSSSESILPILSRASTHEVPTSAEPRYSHKTAVTEVPPIFPLEDAASALERSHVDRQQSPESLEAVDEIELVLRNLRLATQRSVGKSGYAEEQHDRATETSQAKFWSSASTNTTPRITEPSVYRRDSTHVTGGKAKLVG